MNTRDKYFIIGGGRLQCDFIEAVRKMGFEAHVFDANPSCPGAGLADCFHRISIDAADAILSVAEVEEPVAIQTAATELGNVSSCYVGEKLGLRTNSYETALNTTDKCRMKAILLEKGLPTAPYQAVECMDDVNLRGLTFPLVVKPADRSAGRGITIIDNEQLLFLALQKAKKESISGQVVLEPFLSGSQYSLETITAAGVHQVVAITEENFDRITQTIETRHILPAVLSCNLESELIRLAYNALDAFNVFSGAGHIEVRVTNNGPQIIELATRSGGWRDFMINKALSIDYNRLIIEASLGRKLIFKPKMNRYVMAVIITRSCDYALYRRIKDNEPQRLLGDFSANDFKEVDDLSSLMDAQGYFYLHFDTYDEAVDCLAECSP